MSEKAVITSSIVDLALDLFSYNTGNITRLLTLLSCDLSDDACAQRRWRGVVPFQALCMFDAFAFSLGV